MFIVSEDGRHALRIASIDAISMTNYREGQKSEYWAIEARIKDRHFKLMELRDEGVVGAAEWRDTLLSFLVHQNHMGQQSVVYLNDDATIEHLARRYGPKKEKKAA